MTDVAKFFEGSDADSVRAFRRATVANGYKCVRVQSGSKRPIASGWRSGESLETLLEVTVDAMNTGLVLEGLGCIDIDVDNAKIVNELLGLAKETLPAGPLVRFRSNSPRRALIYAATIGSFSKRQVTGSNGRIEILGSAQQLVVHGRHDSGVPLEWCDDRGPHRVRRNDLPKISEQQLSSFLNACPELIGTSSPARPAGTTVNRSNINNFTAGLEPQPWFHRLSSSGKSFVLQACFNVLENQAHDPYDRWMRVVLSAADASRLGCAEARQLALAWSQRGARWSDESAFDKVWHSFRAYSGGVTIGTILGYAKEAGLDLSQWAAMASDDVGGAVPAAAGEEREQPQVQHSAPSAPQKSHELLPRLRRVDEFPPVPKKRRWLHGTDVIRCAVTLLVAPGAKGKTTLLVGLCLALASGKSILGAHVFGGPQCVLFINAEDSSDEIYLRFRAAMTRHCLTDADVARLRIGGVDDWRPSLLRIQGSSTVRDESGWSGLRRLIEEHRPDVIVLDPLVNLLGGVSTNDNAAAALLMNGFVSLAASEDIAIVIAHHTAKGRDPNNAESAMGAAMFTNLARIALSIEPLTEDKATLVGVAPWETKSIFRLIGAKHNLTAAQSSDRWFRIASVQLAKAEPPIYVEGDRVGVVEQFTPNPAASIYPEAMIVAALRAIHCASPPLTPSRRSPTRCAFPVVAAALAPHRGGVASESEAKSLIDHLVRKGFISLSSVTVHRRDGNSDQRDGLVLTPMGMTTLGSSSSAGQADVSRNDPQHAATCDAG